MIILVIRIIAIAIISHMVLILFYSVGTSYSNYPSNLKLYVQHLIEIMLEDTKGIYYYFFLLATLICIFPIMIFYTILKFIKIIEVKINEYYRKIKQV